MKPIKILSEAELRTLGAKEHVLAMLESHIAVKKADRVKIARKAARARWR